MTVVFREGFRFRKVSYNPPARFFHELLTLWSFVIQSVEFTEKPHNSYASLPVNFDISVRSPTIPAPGQTSKLGGFPVNFPDCMAKDQSVNNSWKNLADGLYDTFRKRKPSRKTTGGFINDVKSSFENLSQDKIRNAIDVQPKVIRAIIEANGGHTKYMNSGAAF